MQIALSNHAKGFRAMFILAEYFSPHPEENYRRNVTHYAERHTSTYMVFPSPAQTAKSLLFSVAKKNNFYGYFVDDTHEQQQ